MPALIDGVMLSAHDFRKMVTKHREQRTQEEKCAIKDAVEEQVTAILHHCKDFAERGATGFTWTRNIYAETKEELVRRGFSITSSDMYSHTISW